MTVYTETCSISAGPLPGVTDGEGPVCSEMLTFTKGDSLGTLQPETTGAWQCIRCGLWFSAGPAFYIGGAGPLCTDCRVAL